MKPNIKLLKGLVIAAIALTVVCFIATLLGGLDWIFVIIGVLLVFATVYNLKYYQKYQ